MNGEYVKLKIRKGKENSHVRQLKTQYRPHDKQSSFRSNAPRLDTREIARYPQPSKHIQLKFVPMKGIQTTKKLSTEPHNTLKLNKTQKVAADRIFLYEPAKKKVDRTQQTIPSSKQMTGKDRYQVNEEIGNGTFGTVFQARDKKTLQTVAIKKVFQDKKYKNRELEILKIINHPNILRMKDSFFTVEQDKEYLNVVMDHFSFNLYELIGKYSKKMEFPKLLVKLLAYQLFRGLLYLTVQGIAHRDIKPQNVLVKQSNWKLVICDFGSAKKLKKGQPNIAYICSRSYRAPQLIFGCTEYTTQIDMWSAACVLAQIITIEPIFRAKSSSQHLIQVIKVFGTPSQQEILGMNPNCDLSQFQFPTVPGKGLNKALGNHHLGDQFNDLLRKVFRYDPQQRLTPIEALKHSFFDELRDQRTYVKLARQYPDMQLFNFKETSEKNLKKVAELTPSWFK